MKAEKIINIIEKFETKYKKRPEWLEMPVTEMPVVNRMLQKNENFRTTINGLTILPTNCDYLFAGAYNENNQKQYVMIM